MTMPYPQYPLNMHVYLCLRPLICSIMAIHECIKILIDQNMFIYSAVYSFVLLSGAIPCTRNLSSRIKYKQTSAATAEPFLEVPWLKHSKRFLALRILQGRAKQIAFGSLNDCDIC